MKSLFDNENLCRENSIFRTCNEKGAPRNAILIEIIPEFKNYIIKSYSFVFTITIQSHKNKW